MRVDTYVAHNLTLCQDDSAMLSTNLIKYMCLSHNGSHCAKTPRTHHRTIDNIRHKLCDNLVGSNNKNLLIIVFQNSLWIMSPQ